MLDPGACLEGTLLMGKLLTPRFAPVALSFWAFAPTSAKSLEEVEAGIFTLCIFDLFDLLTFEIILTFLYIFEHLNIS